MRNSIYCKVTGKGIHSFYLENKNGKYFLFNQNYSKSAKEFFENGVNLNEAMDFSRSRGDTVLKKTMSKLPMYIRFIEKDCDIEILNSAIKKKSKNKRDKQIKHLNYDFNYENIYE